jgi:hypothetical protein
MMFRAVNLFTRCLPLYTKTNINAAEQKDRFIFCITQNPDAGVR